jgi:hypothetical protein
MKRLAAAVLLASALSACSSARDPSITKDPSAKATPLPAPFARLGEPCTEETDDVQCGTDGRVAVLVVHQPVAMPAGARFRRTPSTYEVVAVEDGRVWVSGQCIGCRVLLTNEVVAELSHVTDASLARVQAWAGLPPSPPLRTEAAWRAAIRDWEPLGP